MNNTLSVDPGVNGCGIAVWNDDNLLVWAGYVKNSGTGVRKMVDSVGAKLWEKFGTDRCHKLAIEMPQVYMASRSRGDPNDLVELALVVGGFEMWFDGIVFKYKPHSWKGTVPKLIMAERILKRLSYEEQNEIEIAPKSIWHNTIDGVGIGLHHSKRL